MREIFVSGDASKDFERLGIKPNLTYSYDDILQFKIYEVKDCEFETLCNEPNLEGTWEDCGWRHYEGSNMGIPKDEVIVNNKSLKCWYYNDIDEEEDDERFEYDNLLEYFCWHLGASTFTNVCSLATDLAKYNNIKISELFTDYQGNKSN